MSATIDELLQYLDTTARVSCPEITCQRAAELAEVMRNMNAKFDQRMLSVLADHSKERAELIRSRNVEIERRDSFENKSWSLILKVEAAEKERDEARRELAAERERLSSVRQLLKVAEKMYDECANMLTTEREAHEKTKQSACGFAWDVGAEMSRNDGYCMRRPDGTIECRRFVCHQPCAARPGAVSDVEVDASDYERPGKVKP